MAKVELTPIADETGKEVKKATNAAHDDLGSTANGNEIDALNVLVHAVIRV